MEGVMKQSMKVATTTTTTATMNKPQKPYYKSDVPANASYQEAVKEAKQAWKQAREEAKQAKQEERAAQKRFNEEHKKFLYACLDEACISPEEILDRIASAAYTINPKTKMPYNSFRHFISFKNDFMGEIEGVEIYKSDILASPAFQIEAKKHFKSFDCSGVRFSFPEGKSQLIMTIFLEPKEVKEKPKERVKEAKQSKPVQKHTNQYAFLENDD
jgi:hypothetical protein